MNPQEIEDALTQLATRVSHLEHTVVTKAMTAPPANKAITSPPASKPVTAPPVAKELHLNPLPTEPQK